MFTILRTARSWPTILPKRRRSKSRTSLLRISGSSSTSSETYGLTIALHLLSEALNSGLTLHRSTFSANQTQRTACHPVYSALPQLLTAILSFRWNSYSATSCPRKLYRQCTIGALGDVFNELSGFSRLV